MKTPATEPASARYRDRLVFASVLLLLLYFLVRNLAAAVIKPFWTDELLTWIVARQPTVSAVFGALTQAVDGQPPTYHLFERFFDKLIPFDHIAFRLPSILAFCLFEWCIFIWLRERYRVGIALICLLIPVLTVLYGNFAVEARPYALVAACLALGAVSYQRLPATIWTIVLAASLLAVALVHYYAVIFCAPFFAAELLYCVRKKCFRWPVWTAFATVVLPAIVFWPILSRFKSYYAGHYWSHASFITAFRAYGWFFGISQGPLSSFSWSLLAGLALSAIALIVGLILGLRSLSQDTLQHPYFHEQCLIAGFLLLPLLLCVAAKLTQGGFTPRYLVPTVLGITLAAARGISYLSRPAVALLGGLLLFAAVIQETGFWFSFSTARQLGFSKPVEQLVAAVGHQDLPLFVANGHDYLQSDHYATPAWKQRMLFFADSSAAVAHGQADTLDKELLAVSQVTPLRILEFESVRSSFPKFLVYSDPSPENNPDWWTLRLLADGYSLQKLSTDGHSSVYLAELHHAN